MISKELLSEVLNLNITYIERCNNSIIYKISVYDREEEVNIYELAHKCKSWALIRGYSLLSGRPIVRDEEGTQVFNYWYNCYIWEIDENSIDSPTQNTKIETNSETEPEAIIKACEWILKEQNNGLCS